MSNDGKSKFGGKIQYRELDKEERIGLKHEFFSTMESLKVPKESIDFFEDLFTESEWIMFARRIQIAKRLLIGHSFLKIKRDLGVGLETITSVSEWLESKFEDYRTILPPLLEEKRESAKKHGRKKIQLPRSLYPTKFRLLNVLLIDVLDAVPHAK